MTTSVLVSGATGFIAQHTIQLLLSKGYTVIGTVRTAEKGKNLVKSFGSGSLSYEVVPTLEVPGAFDEALEKHPEVTVFLHMASPVVFNVKDVEKELLLPAVEGTKNALSAIKAHGPQIKHVVITSSIAAQFDYEKENDPSYTVSEESWNPVTWEQAKKDGSYGYGGSKTFAERAAWDFYAKEKPNFTLNVVNPAYVFGPQVFEASVKKDLNASVEIINSLLKLTPESAVPELDGFFIDVRDVAKAHVAAFEKGFTKQRLLLSAERFSSHDLLEIINKSFVSLSGKLPDAKKERKTLFTLQNDKTKQLLNTPFVDLHTSVVDTVTQIVNAQKAIV